MNVAAICEFILGNTFPFTVFMIVSYNPSSIWASCFIAHDSYNNLIYVQGSET